MTDTPVLQSEGFSPSEELMFEKAECRTRGVKRHSDARAWVHQHARDTDHPVQLTFGYDLRADNWLDRVSAPRRAELDELREKPETARALAEQLLQSSKGQKPH